MHTPCRHSRRASTQATRTRTLSHARHIPSLFFSLRRYTGPVINLPEVAIAGMGKIRPTPRYDASGALVKQAVMQISWSGDHRVIDGGTMARFSNSWIGYLEQPGTMLLHL